MSTAAPDQLAILPLEACTKASPRQIGDRGSELVDLLQLKLPIPETYIIPSSVLEKIFLHNDLYPKFEQLFNLTPWENAQSVAEQAAIAQEYIEHADIPEDVTKVLVKAYAEWLEDEYIAVRPSFTSPTATPAHLSDLHVLGESNLVESLLHVWAKAYQPELFRERYNEWQQGLTIPMAIILQRMVKAPSSGYALVGHHPQHPHAVEIFAGWGIVRSGRTATTQLDTFTVDIKTHEVISHTIQVKTKELIHQPDALKERAVPHERQTQASITREHLTELIEMIHRIGKRIFLPHRIEWAIEKEHMYLLGVATDSHTSSVRKSAQSSVTPKVVSSQVQTFQHITSAQEIATVPSASLDGIVFTAEEIFMETGLHPAYMLQQGKAGGVRDTIAKHLAKVMANHSSWRVIYRSQDLLSHQLRCLEHGKNYEAPEPNPYLGYHGAIRDIHNTQLFDLELDALTEVYDRSKQKMTLLVPWVRQPKELQHITQHLAKPPYHNHAFLHLWLECNTPATVLQINEYFNYGVEAIVFNLEDIYHLLLGIDPMYQDISKLYPYNTSLLQLLLRPAINEAKKHNVKTFASVAHNDPAMKEWVIQLGVDGIIQNYQKR